MDCPIDSFIMKENQIKKIPLKNIGIKDYEEIQKFLESKYKLRLIADIKAWDSKKIY